VKYSMWPFWLKVAIGILNVVLAGVGWLGWARVEDGRRWILWGIVAYFVVFLAILCTLKETFLPSRDRGNRAGSQFLDASSDHKHQLQIKGK